MTAPTATATVVGGPLTLTAAAPIASVVCTDTGTYDPVATGRSWKADTVVVTGAVDEVETISFCGPGTFTVVQNVVNADGNDDTAGTNVVFSDGYSAPSYMTGEVASRILPSALPAEYRDALVATPGIPTANKIYQARTYGSILPSADRVNVVCNGVAQYINPA